MIKTMMERQEYIDKSASHQKHSDKALI